ncbi:hypothetical protein M5689_006267 [Euphorbia peplus]|nr:hypothetical protein M5689_006267 [Euphorbia peplus]
MGDSFLKLGVHHKGKFEINNAIKVVEYINGVYTVLDPLLDFDKMSYPNMWSYLKDIGYEKAQQLYYKCKITNQFLLVFDDTSVLDAISKLKNGDKFDLFIDHYDPLHVEDGIVDDVVSLGNENLVDEQFTNNEAEFLFEELLDVQEPPASLVVDQQDDNVFNLSNIISVGDLGEEQDAQINRERRREQHTNLDDMLFPVSFLTDDDEEELQEAREKLKVYKKSNNKGCKQGEIDREEVSNDKAFENFDAEDDKVATSDESSESAHESDYFSSDEEGSYYSGTDEELDEVFRRHSSTMWFDPTTTIPIFCTGMVFYNVEQFRNAVAIYALRKTLGVHFVKNEKERVQAHCVENCPWVLFASNESKKDKTFKVKTYIPQHKCKTVRKSVFANAAYLSKHYKQIVQLKPNIKLREIKELVRKDFKLLVNLTVCQSIKKKIKLELEGDVKREFALLTAYAREIRKTNLGTNCQVVVNRENLDGQPLFSRFYVCFNACKKGWKEGCRPIIGLDGCFLKGMCKGQLLCAVGRDGNNPMFPIAWAVVVGPIKNRIT